MKERAASGEAEQTLRRNRVWSLVQAWVGKREQLHLPSSMSCLLVYRIIDRKRFGVMLARCEAGLKSDLCDRSWAFLRIRLTGQATELYLSDQMSIQCRPVGRVNLLRADSFVGAPAATNRAWMLIIRGAAYKRAGRLTQISGGQAAYVEEVPWGEPDKNAAQKLTMNM